MNGAEIQYTLQRNELQKMEQNQKWLWIKLKIDFNATASLSNTFRHIGQMNQFEL